MWDASIVEIRHGRVELTKQAVLETFQPVHDEESVLSREHNGERLLLGYLSHDDDCENPLTSCDGLGQVIQARQDGFSSALDLDDNVIGPDADPDAVLLVGSTQSWDVVVDPHEFDLTKFRSSSLAVWMPDRAAREHIEYTAVQRLLPKGTKVEYRTVLGEDGKVIYTPEGWIDRRYFNNITYTLPDGRHRGGYKTFLDAIRGAARKLGVKLRAADVRHSRRAAALATAQHALDVYNEWLNGECYGVVFELFDMEEGEQLEEASCWGYIGWNSALESLQEEFEYYWKSWVMKEEQPVEPPPMGRLVLPRRKTCSSPTPS